MTATEPIARRKLYQEVVERMLDWIKTGRYAPGDQLPSERQLMETFGVGRPAVREALLALQRMGMISIVHGERARVLAPTADTMLEQVSAIAQHMLASSPDALGHLREARVFFETGMVRIAAQRATADDVRRLEAILEEHRRAAPGTPAFLDRDMAFHRAIAEISGNPIFSSLSSAMFTWLSAFHADLIRAPGAERLTLEEHGRILAGIAAHDPEEAAAAMDAHLTRANALYAQLLKTPR